MLKAICSNSYDFGEPALSLVDVHSRGVDKTWMEKRSALFTSEIENIRPEKGRSFIHLIAMGSCDRYGGNRNGDWFTKTAQTFVIPYPEEHPKGKGTDFVKVSCGLVERHPTFVKFGNVFSHHQNKDPKKASGIIHASAWNPEMDRVELIINVDNGKWENDLTKLASGDDIPVSMACKVPWDICTVCSNHARNRSEYCTHAKNSMTQITKEGHLVGVLNERPTFFDISRVLRPADRIAWSLQKVASAASISSAALAEEMGLVAPLGVAMDAPLIMMKRAGQLRKLSEMEKEVEGELQGNGTKRGIIRLTVAIPDDDQLDEKDTKTLRSDDLNNVLGQMSDKGVSLGLKDFLRLAMGDIDDLGGMLPTASSMLPSVFRDISEEGETEDVVGDSTYKPTKGKVSKDTNAVTDKLGEKCSLFRGPVMRRIMVVKISPRRNSTSKDTQVEKASAETFSKAKVLAREYAKYKIAFASAHSDDETINTLTVLQNFVQ